MAERVLLKEVIVPGGTPEVWAAWTTAAGVRTFFAPEAKIELVPGGPYELYFDAEQPAGLRGSEGCTVIEVQPERRLVFTWNFPPHMPSIRGERTRVELSFQPTASGWTYVGLRQVGWRDGEEWERGYAYFDRAWEMVLDRLAERFRSG